MEDTRDLAGLDTNTRIQRALLGAFIGALIGFLFFVVGALVTVPLGAWLGWRTGDPTVMARKEAKSRVKALVFRCRDQKGGFMVHYPAGTRVRYQTLEGAQKNADEFNEKVAARNAR